MKFFYAPPLLFPPTVHHKRKSLAIRSNSKAFQSVGVTGFEPATTRPPDVYSNRTELRPDSFLPYVKNDSFPFGIANIITFLQSQAIFRLFFQRTPCAQTTNPFETRKIRTFRSRESRSAFFNDRPPRRRLISGRHRTTRRRIPDTSRPDRTAASISSFERSPRADERPHWPS